MEVDVPIWNEHGRWGVSQSGLLPALRFSRDEALESGGELVDQLGRQPKTE